MLGARNISWKDEFFTRGRNEALDVYYISQSYFSSTGQSIRKKSDWKVLFKQTFRDVESMYKDIGGYDILYWDFKEICRRVSGEKRFNNVRFCRKMYFDEKPRGKKSLRDIASIRLLKSPGWLILASGVSQSHKRKSFSKTKFLPSGPNQQLDRLKMLLQKNKLVIFPKQLMKKSLL